MNGLWGELVEDWATMAMYWQLAVLVASLLAAVLLNRLLHRHVVTRAPASWHVGVEGVKRVLFPLSALAFLTLGSLILRQGYHTGLLSLAATLLVAMAVIRAAVYLLRYIFAPSQGLRTTEGLIVGVVWILFILNLTGALPDMQRALEDASFTVGKNRFSVLLIIEALFTMGVTIIVALTVSRFLENRLMRAERIQMNLRVVFSKLTRILLAVIGGLVALSAVGFDITLLSVFGGALGVGLGLGLQKIASSYVSGFILLLDESLRLGDIIAIDGHYGRVRQIRSRYLLLRKLDGTEVAIPNETLVSSAVVNYSSVAHRARFDLAIRIALDSAPEKALALMLQAAAEHARILKTPAPEAHLVGFGEQGVDLQLTFWVTDLEEGVGGLKSDLYLALWRAFCAQGITVPRPQRDIRIVEDARQP